MALTLSAEDRGRINGEAGPAQAFAFEILHAFASSVGAEGFIDITGSHIDGCLYHGQVSLDFVERLVSLGGRVAVPTTLNVGSVDLIHPEIMRMTRDQQQPLARLMLAHEELGCMPSYTCAPYQTMFRPSFGQQIAWGESNAIVFANSVIGARTNRYGDFVDLCCAITGRAPAYGLHLDENRRGRILFRLEGFRDGQFDLDELYVAIGLILGLKSGDRVPVIEGLPLPRDEDQLKALGAAAASSGAVGLFHAVGITPEAPTLNAAFHGYAPDETIVVTPEDMRDVLSHLSTSPDGTPITAACFGTPHFSRTEWERLIPLLRDAQPKTGIPIYVNTSREVHAGLLRDGLLDGLDACGLKVVTDTCTYLTAILERLDGTVMTNSGKWAHYAPSNIGVQVGFGSMEDCVASAAAGRIVRLGR